MQTNFGGVLTINGAPVGQALGRYYLRDVVAPDASRDPSRDPEDDADGSVIIVVATDAPVDARNLKRLAARALFGLARTGAAGSNGSGDYVIAFSTHRGTVSDRSRVTRVVENEAMSPLFLAVIESTEEAIYNSLFHAKTTTGREVTVEGLPIDRTLEILREHRLLDR